jgi:hypothetical protein
MAKSKRSSITRRSASMSKPTELVSRASSETLKKKSTNQKTEDAGTATVLGSDDVLECLECGSKFTKADMAPPQFVTAQGHRIDISYEKFYEMYPDMHITIECCMCGNLVEIARPKDKMNGKRLLS